jgi:hypothetical protein
MHTLASGRLSISYYTNEFGLDIEEKTSKGKVYQVIKGETLGLDDILTTNGFTKGQTGKWGREKSLFDN